ncbi:MAG: translation initiation factor IF-2 N-terminal domain-containing protein, partial [Acidimicrobiales bacterium]
MAARIRLYELARELGLSNKETLDLCVALGIGVKSHSSSIEDAQADRVRRKADREGLRRPVQPEEPGTGAAPAKPAARDGGAPDAGSPRVGAPDGGAPRVGPPDAGPPGPGPTEGDAPTRPAEPRRLVTSVPTEHAHPAPAAHRPLTGDAPSA